MKATLFLGGLCLASVLPSLALAPPPAKDATPQTALHFSREPFVIDILKSSLRFAADGTGAKNVQTRALGQTERALQQLRQLGLDYNSEFERLTDARRVIKPASNTA